MALGSRAQDGGGNATRELNSRTSFGFGRPFSWYCLLLAKCKKKSEGSRSLEVLPAKGTAAPGKVEGCLEGKASTSPATYMFMTICALIA